MECDAQYAKSTDKTELITDWSGTYIIRTKCSSGKPIATINIWSKSISSTANSRTNVGCNIEFTDEHAKVPNITSRYGRYQGKLVIMTPLILT